MGLSQLSERCRKCPKVSTCNHKRMEALGYLTPCPEHLANGMQTSVVLCDEIETAKGGIIPGTVNLCGDNVINIGGESIAKPEFEKFAEEVKKRIAHAIGVPEDILFGRYGTR